MRPKPSVKSGSKNTANIGNTENDTSDTRIRYSIWGESSQIREFMLSSFHCSANGLIYLMISDYLILAALARLKMALFSNGG